MPRLLVLVSLCLLSAARAQQPANAPFVNAAPLPPAPFTTTGEALVEIYTLPLNCVSP